MIINRLENIAVNNMIISMDILKISNINFISRTITINKDQELFSAATTQSKIIISQSQPIAVSIQS